MIELNANVPDHFLVLERKETFGEYARTYGDALAVHYENRGVIVVPFMPITFDLGLFQSIPFPIEWKKIGTLNGIEEPVCSPRSPASIGNCGAVCKCCSRPIDPCRMSTSLGG
jgi:hypothetical protein